MTRCPIRRRSIERIGGVLLAAALLAAAGASAARDRVWFIGGGNDLDNSQAQIEQNVLWASRVVGALPGEREVRIFFTDGDDPGPDVKEYPAPAGSYLEPIARLYALDEIGGYIGRNHRLSGVAGGTQREQLVPRLEQELARLLPGERALIVFNGHGTRGRRDAADNRLWLWQDSFLTVRDFERLLAQAHPKATVRFVLTQCYAGGFARAVRAAAGRTLELAPGERCGFLAEAADRPAEGCSAAVDSRDYRDYTTFFFAALAGRTRDGGALPFAPDRDGDGRVSLYEAHLYSLRAAQSSDLPRTTSEVYLEDWRPWYPDWRIGLGLASQRPNVYAQLAAELAGDLGLPGEPGEQAQRLEERREARRRELRTLKREERLLRRQIRDAQRDILRELVESNSVPAGFRADWMLRDDAPARAAAAAVEGHERYAGLVRDQGRYARIVAELLDQERALTQFDKLERLHQLARLRDRFERDAAAGERAGYERLLACEQGAL